MTLPGFYKVAYQFSHNFYWEPGLQYRPDVPHRRPTNLGGVRNVQPPICGGGRIIQWTGSASGFPPRGSRFRRSPRLDRYLV